MTGQYSGALRNLVALLQKTGYITQQLVNGTTGYANGPAGTLLRHNITQSWWETMVVRSPATFPVTCQSSDPLVFFHDVFNLRNKSLPFSMSLISSQTPELTRLSSEVHSLLDPNKETTMRYLHVCPPSSINQTFDQIVNKRVNWWKKFSWKSTDFVQCDANNGSIEPAKSELPGVDIKYQFPWGPETIETVHCLSEQTFKDLEEKTGTSCKIANGRKEVLPACVDCSSCVEMALVVFLTDAYTEKAPQDGALDTKQVLHIHPMLAPFKAALCLSGAKQRQIREVSTYIARMLRTSGLQILDIMDSKNNMEEQINLYDSIGVPFTIVINDTTIETGTVQLRNRETTINETMAINKLEEYILKHVMYSG